MNVKHTAEKIIDKMKTGMDNFNIFFGILLSFWIGERFWFIDGGRYKSTCGDGGTERIVDFMRKEFIEFSFSLSGMMDILHNFGKQYAMSSFDSITQEQK
jgi:hypothetical protein